MCASEVCSGYRRERLSAKEPVAMSELWGKKDLKRSVVCTLGKHIHKEERRKKGKKARKLLWRQGKSLFWEKKSINTVISVLCDAEYIRVDLMLLLMDISDLC